MSMGKVIRIEDWRQHLNTFFVQNNREAKDTEFCAADLALERKIPIPRAHELIRRWRTEGHVKFSRAIITLTEAGRACKRDYYVIRV